DFGTLTLVGSVYQLREQSGMVTVFRPDGTLDYEQDPDGNRITAGYNTLGQLSSLTHSNGAALHLHYHPHGLIDQVTDPAGRVTNYAYDDSGEHLRTVTGPTGTITYTYVSGQGAASEHALASVTNPDGSEIDFTYDGQGRLASRSANGGASLTYN